MLEEDRAVGCGGRLVLRMLLQENRMFLRSWGTCEMPVIFTLMAVLYVILFPNLRTFSLMKIFQEQLLMFSKGSW